MSITHNIKEATPEPMKLSDAWDDDSIVGFIIPEIDALVINTSDGVIVSCDGGMDCITRLDNLQGHYSVDSDTVCFAITSINIVYEME